MIRFGIIWLLLPLILFTCKELQDGSQHPEQGTPNALINETSPYLLQHAYNPVNWQPWNDKTLALAKKQNKLMIISVGYSACHWCHVMEEESFENDTVAQLMNDNFINIKVDREERPDVDDVYMNAVQLMTGGGGWPLNCITLPDGRPVFGGTYFTKKQWLKILSDISNLYMENPNKMVAYAEQLTEGVRQSDLISVNKKPTPFTRDSISNAVKRFQEVLDFKNGGIKGAPKFPTPSHLDFLLRYSHQFQDVVIENYVSTTLNEMANGGIYDQIGGGFSRYSVDSKWHIPHFEKMLYDNAQLVSTYAHAYQKTKNERFKLIIQETLDFVSQELETAEGAFYASIDADSKNQNKELEEGAYYVWKAQELETILKDDYPLFKDYYNVNQTGYWENNNYVLFKTMADKDFVEKHNLNPENFRLKRQQWKKQLLLVREQREKPRLDDKVLTSWNALMLNAYVDAYKAIGNKQYLNKAIKNGNFLLKQQLNTKGELYHNYKDGKTTIRGFSEDYALTIKAFINLYEVTLEEQWLRTARKLMDYTIEHFYNEENKMFFFTSKTSSNLIARKTQIFDNVMPSSNSVLAEGLFKLGHYYGEKTYMEASKQMVKNVYEDLLKKPSAYTNWLNVLLNYTGPFYEVAITGKNAKQKIEELHSSYLPNIIICGATEESNLPLLKYKFNDTETLIYVCVNGTCKLPVSSTEKAISQILK